MAKKDEKKFIVKSMINYKGENIPIEELDNYPEAKEAWLDHITKAMVPLLSNLLEKQEIRKTTDLNASIVKEITVASNKKEIAKLILDDLPEWFGITEHTQNYIKQSAKMLFFSIFLDEKPIGFISLKRTSKDTAEIYCMGLLKKYRFNGFGKKLYFHFEQFALKKKYKYIQVKTVECGRYKEYDDTNKFYKAVGFSEFDVFPTLWDENNPCQIYVKSIS